MANLKLKYTYFLIAVALFIYLFLVFDINFCGPDEPIYYAYTASIVENGDLNTVNQVYNDYGQYVSKTYNLPDFHNHGGVVFWAPCYVYGRFVYSIAHRLNIANIFNEGLDNIAKCAMSFSTIVVAFITLLFTFLLCRKFFSDKISMWSTLLMFFATPFSYFTLFETGNSQIAASMLLVIAMFTLYCYAKSLQKNHWFLLGMLLSVGLALRVELWAALLLFIIPYVLILCLSRRIRWGHGLFFIIGLLPIFILRSVNAYLKFGTFRPEEMFFINSFIKFAASYKFNGFFNSFRGVFYSSPVILICLAGVAVSVLELLKKVSKKQERLKEYFLVTASAYMVLKLYSLSGLFSPSGDGLTGRCFLTEFPIFVLLYGYFLERQKGKMRLALYVISVFLLIWNLLIMAEYIVGFDWLYVSFAPNLALRLTNLQYIFFPLFCEKDFFIKCIICLPIAGIIFAAFYFMLKNIATVNYKDRAGAGYLRLFCWLSIILSSIYFIITLLNIGNNRNNVQRLKSQSYFKSARIIETNTLQLSEYEEEERLWTFFKERSYYALQGDINMMQVINHQRERIFNNRPRLRHDRIPLQVFRVHPAFYNTGGRYKKALESYERAVSIDPQDFEAYLSLGDIYSIVWDYYSAIESYKKALSINPGVMRLYVVLGNLYESIENFDMAVFYYQKAVQINPSLAEAYIGLASVYNSKNDYNKAIIYYQKYLEFNPKSSDVYRSLAEAYGKINDQSKQIECFNNAVTLNPRASENYRSLAEAYRNINDYNKAIIYYQKYLEFNPKSSDVYRSLAEAYGKINDQSKQIECFNNAVTLNPRASENYRSLAEAHRNINDYNKAIIYYQKYLEFNPKSSDVYNDLANTYREINEYDKAIEAYNQVIRLKPNDPWVYFDLGRTYNIKNDLENVFKQINMLKKLNQEDLARRLEQSLRKE